MVFPRCFSLYNEFMSKQTEVVLEWYDRHRRRNMPWREDPKPYHVWLSEIMLQQTRVDTVIDYYNRFLEELPDVASLAAAEEDRYLKLWEGLGYYSRIRNMHKAALRIMEDYEGEIPSEAAELQKLPGIGEYTAAAISSIAFGRPEPSIDGNLLRVFSRLNCFGVDIKSKEAHKAAMEFYREHISLDRPGDFNQALMDIGSGICVPGGVPLCEKCPLTDFCLAPAAGKETDYPLMPAKKGRTIENRTIFLIRDSESVLIRRRPKKGLLAGLYEFPGVEKTLKKKEAESLLRSLGFDPREIRKTKPVKHIFSHKEWRMTGYEVTVEKIGTALKAVNERLASIKDGSGALGVSDETNVFSELLEARFAELEKTYALPSAFAAFCALIEKT